MKKDSPDKAQNEQVEEENNLDTTPASEEQDSGEILEPAAETEATAEEEAEEEGTETGESVQKKGYSQRVREFNERAKEAEAKAQSLEERIAELTAPVGQQQYQPPQDQPIIAPGEEIDASELDRRLRDREQGILRQADAMSELRARQSEAVNRINTETSEVMRKNPELDPESDSFDKELSDSVTEATEAYVRSNPYTASVKKFVDKLMKPYRRAVTKEVGKATENLAKQVSETAVRPTSVSKTEKPFSELSIEEMEAKLGKVCP